MKNCTMALGLFLISMTASAQYAFDEDTFPVFTPFTDQADIAANARPYYAIDSLYVDNTFCDYRTTDCKKGTFQYNFEPGAAIGDGNSDLDVYYSTEWDTSLAPNGKPLVVVLHGISNNKEAQSVSRRAIELTKRGYVAIVPNYTTAAAIEYGANPFTLCLDETEIQYPFQLSVREIRAAIKRTMFLASKSTSDVKVDSSSVFIWGYSYGGITPLHLVNATDSTEWPTGTVNINGTNYTFSSDLNDIDICNPSETGCPTSYYSTTYDPVENIRGVSSIAGFISDTTMIEVKDSVPTLMFHGTCDGIAPFGAPTSREATYRRAIYRDSSIAVLSEVSCYDAANTQMDYRLYGSQAIWRRYKSLENANSNYRPYRGFLRICGASHNVETYYGIDDVGPGSTTINNIDMFEYETFRFFSNILNGDMQDNFVFNLAHDSLPGRDVLVPNDTVTFSEQDADFCTSVPQWGDSLRFDSTRSDSIYPKGDPNQTELSFISRWICPSCADGAPAFKLAAEIRHPMFEDNDDDSDRYPAFDPDPCPELIVVQDDFIEFHHSQLAPNTVTVLNSNGDFLREVALDVQSSRVTRVLINKLDLPSGTYYLHFDNGEKETVVVR